ncbi:MAG: L-2-hydroxyglutarate oxidase [Mesorhizobium sp.]|nr:L-2-hydroxyglutarate oxidase [Mesorhizobium sp.]
MYDFCVIGGGIVGLATAMRLLERHPGASLVLLEKETGLACHQTGHNSGVIHAGIYYPPGSLKAELCRQGAVATKEFCAQHGIAFDTCGKLLVATDAEELSRMEALWERSRTNSVGAIRLGADELKEREPRIVGVGALLVPSTGIVDYAQVSRAMGSEITRRGAEIRLGARVSHIKEVGGLVTVEASGRMITARRLVACAGLQSDRIAALSGLTLSHRIIPFRGEYFTLPPDKNEIVQHLIYPIPDPALPFLGIHLTRMIDGSVTVGPNAVLGFAREGYRKGSFSLPDMADFARFPGFWRTIFNNIGSGATEFRNSIWKAGYLRECQKYCPELTLEDLRPREAGIRAQAVMKDGTLVHDFLFLETERMLHVCNAPSPAATAAIPIADMIVDRLATSQ